MTQTTDTILDRIVADKRDEVAAARRRVPLAAVKAGAAAAPHARDFAAALGKTLRRPAIVPAPAIAVKLLLGEMATVVLEGQRAVPKRALDLGFRFRFPDLGPALRDALGS